MKLFRTEHPATSVTLRWVPGHECIEGSEKADKEAKQAAAVRSSPSDDLPKQLRKRLLTSASRLLQNYKTHLTAQASGRWAKSSRGQKMTRVAGPLPSPQLTNLVNTLSRRHAGLYMQLRTGHGPLTSHLARIGPALFPTCPTCGEGPETPYHFLRECTTYSLHRAVPLGVLGRAGTSVKYLLSSDKAVRPLFKYMHATGQFCRIFAVFADMPQPEE